MPEFEVVADSELITVDGFTIVPAEADILKGAVSFAGSMREINPLPAQIHYQQFTVQFFEDGTLIVDRGDGGEELKFSFDTVDRLVVAITDAVNISIDKKKLRPSPRSVGDPGFMADGELL